MNWSNQTSVTWSIAFHTDEWLDRGLGDDFVVVLANPCFLACNVWSGEHVQQEVGMIGFGWWNEWFHDWCCPF